MISHPVSRLARIAGADFAGSAEVLGISADSRSVRLGDLFVCMPSGRIDTHEFLDEAASKGAVAAAVRDVVGAERAGSLGLSWLLLDRNTNAFYQAIGLLAREIFGDPSQFLKVVAVTGTNGKTTTAWTVKHALDTLGCRAGYVGTLGVLLNETLQESANTTPFPVEIWSLLADAREASLDCVVLEASSHALFERRLGGVRFDVGVFTNLTQDHLDFHGDMASYSQAKELLFSEFAVASGKPFVGVLNTDTETGRKWRETVPCDVLAFGAGPSDLVLVASEIAVEGNHLTVSYQGADVSFETRLAGAFNIENAMAALGALLALGYSLADACAALETVQPVPGRFEIIASDTGIGVVVDYAHTPDAIEKLLRSVRELKPKRMITVFGCGGDRDRTKRPKMAQVVAALSDVAVITSDNPRTEDPWTILEDIKQGLPDGFTASSIENRREAIEYALRIAQEGDIVAIAGKGHEDYQIIGRTKHHFDDREVVRQCLGSVR